MAGGHIALKRREGPIFNDVTEHLLHVLRTQVAGANDLSEGQWRVTRNKLLRLLTETTWTDHGPLRQLSYFIEQTARKNQSIMYPYMCNAINWVRAASTFPQRQDRAAFNLRVLNLVSVMSTVVDVSHRGGNPQKIPNLEDNPELAAFLKAWKIQESDFIQVYLTMHDLWQREQYTSSQAILDVRDPSSMATAYFKRAHTRIGLPYTDQLFASTVYGYTVNRATTPGDCSLAKDCWEIYAMRFAMEIFATGAFGKHAAKDIWVDSITISGQTLSSRPPNADWLTRSEYREMKNRTRY